MRSYRSVSSIEFLETRTVLDCMGLFGAGIDFDESEFVKEHPNGSLQFASLRVGQLWGQGGEAIVLEDDVVVEVNGTELTMAEIKEYLHGFADSVGTDSFIETLDLRQTEWGSGSGSTSKRFEDFIEEHTSSGSSCTGLRFAGAVRFDLPGEGGELFTGGFLEINEEGTGGILRGGDIVEVVLGYDISAEGAMVTLAVESQFGDAIEFTVNEDQTLTDSFGQQWSPSASYELIDDDGSLVWSVDGEPVDHVIGDIDLSGTVDFADFLILSNNFGTESSHGDLNDDGIVNFADFLLLSSNYGP